MFKRFQKNKVQKNNVQITFSLFTIYEAEYITPKWLGTFATLEEAFQNALIDYKHPIMIIKCSNENSDNDLKDITYYKLKCGKFNQITDESSIYKYTKLYWETL